MEKIYSKKSFQKDVLTKLHTKRKCEIRVKLESQGPYQQDQQYTFGFYVDDKYSGRKIHSIPKSDIEPDDKPAEWEIYDIDQFLKKMAVPHKVTKSEGDEVIIKAEAPDKKQK